MCRVWFEPSWKRSGGAFQARTAEPGKPTRPQHSNQMQGGYALMNGQDMPRKTWAEAHPALAIYDCNFISLSLFALQHQNLKKCRNRNPIILPLEKINGAGM